MLAILSKAKQGIHELLLIFLILSFLCWRSYHKAEHNTGVVNQGNIVASVLERKMQNYYSKLHPLTWDKLCIGSLDAEGFLLLDYCYILATEF